MPTLADILATTRGPDRTAWYAGVVTAVAGQTLTVRIDNAQGGADSLKVRSVGPVAAQGARVLVVTTRVGTYSLGTIGA